MVGGMYSADLLFATVFLASMSSKDLGRSGGIAIKMITVSNCPDVRSGDRQIYGLAVNVSLARKVQRSHLRNGRGRIRPLRHLVSIASAVAP